jgi:NAD(P)-dependent dehydrogenase (short-subunit alcohol dehydrogenase family)
MVGKWILISGGNSGIGREACLQFAQWGANIVMACRSNAPPREPQPSSVVEECKHAAKAVGISSSVIECWEVDMASIASVEALAKRWRDTGRPLDILCNNAGLSSTLNKTVLTTDGFELIHQVNFISHVLLTLSLLPALEKAVEPRVICTVSNMQYLGIFNLANANAGSDVAYPNNKLYFQIWLTELQVRLSLNPKYKHIVVHGVHPGYVQTNIWNPLTKENLKNMSWGEWLLGKLLPYLGINAQQGSLCITNAASSPELSLVALKPDPKDGIVGAKFMNRIRECTPMPHARHEGCRRMVWEFVDEELKLSEKGLLEGL